MGVFLRFEDDSVESAKQVMQWNVKIINVRDLSCIFSTIAIEQYEGVVYWIVNSRYPS